MNPQFAILISKEANDFKRIYISWYLIVYSDRSRNGESNFIDINIYIFDFLFSKRESYFVASSGSVFVM